MADDVPWLGAIYGAVYVALYTRFASQWAYLAGLYNQIKQTECDVAELFPVQTSTSDDGTSQALAQRRAVLLCEWKAGFIEDCSVLHLARNPSFAALIIHWAADPCVCDAFDQKSPGGSTKLDKILAEAEAVFGAR